MIILNEDAKLSFSQVYTFVRMLYKPYNEWDAFKTGVIDIEGNILKPDSLDWMELLVRNVRELILKYARVKGTKGHAVLDKNIYRYIDFLKESCKQYKLTDHVLNEHEILTIVITEKFNKLMEKI